jgi:hypothetical protein
MANIAGLVGIGVSGVALILASVALASNRWETITFEPSIEEVTVGLWEICTTDSVSTTCADFEDVDSSFGMSKCFFFFLYRLK